MRPSRAATLQPNRLRSHVRALRTDDVGELAALARKLGGSERATDWSRVLGRRDAVAIAIEVEGALAGYAVGSVRLAFGGHVPVGWIEHFGVDVAWRGRGIGRALAEGLLSRLREAGARQARTIVPLHDRELAPFFHEIGFSEEPVVCLGREL